MNRIKLRKSTKDIKVFDKAKDLSKHIKFSYVKTKEKAEENHETYCDTPQAYCIRGVDDGKRKNLLFYRP